MDVELFCQREAKVWYGALKFFHSTGCIFSALGWSALFQIYVNHLWSLHLGFTLCFFLASSSPILIPYLILLLIFYFYLICVFLTGDTTLQKTPSLPPKNMQIKT